MPWLSLAAQVFATLVATLGLLWVTWRKGRFPFFTALWKVALFSVFVAFMTVSVNVVVNTAVVSLHWELMESVIDKERDCPYPIVESNVVRETPYPVRKLRH